MRFRVVHSLDWRTRIKCPALAQQKEVAQQLADCLDVVPGVSYVEIRLSTGSIILLHSGRALDTAAVGEILSSALPGEGSAPSRWECTAGSPASLPDANRRSHVSGTILVLSGAYILFEWLRRLLFSRGGAGRFSLLSRVFNPPALVAIGLGIPIMKEALKNLANRGFSMDLLVTSAAGLSILMGEAMAALVVMWLVNFSEWLETRTVEKTRKAIRDMLSHDVRDTWVVRDGTEVLIAVSDLVKGDIVAIRQGDSVPADGKVVEGEALINESAMTGESRPVFKVVEDVVLAGTTLEMGKLLVQVESVGEETRMGQIIRIIEEGQEQKAEIILSSQRFSDSVVPFSLALSLLTYFITGNIHRAMAMLIIACPCGVSLSTPTALSAAMGNAARQGSLVKGGRYLEGAGKIKHLTFDKTGTLTSGVPQVSRVISLDERYDPIRILQLAASSQMHYKHPMTLAVLKKVRESEIEIPQHEKTELIIGHGVKAKINGDEILVGSHHFMEDYQVDHEMGHKEEETMLAKGESVLFVACNRRLIGLMGVEDRMKETASEALSALKALGVEHIAMFTGDREQHARALAQSLPIDTIRWEQSPEDKASWVMHCKKLYPDHVVAMVGDGINDAPAFSHADISFAMGDTGADIAIEHADIVLHNGDLSLVAQTVALGQKTLDVIRQNYGISVGLNVAGMLLAAIGWLPPLAGAVFHNMITVGVVSNSAKLLFYKADLAELAQAAKGHGNGHNDISRPRTAVGRSALPAGPTDGRNISTTFDDHNLRIHADEAV
ncbi:MAG: heavy metal translocating P-type ATPase [Pseudomonadota bacterium]